MSITIKKYSPKDSLKWDDFVQKSNNGTLFHNRSFLNYHIDRSFKDSSVIFERGSSIVAVLPAAEVMISSEKVFYSHPGATFGGIVYNNLIFKDAEKIIEKLVDYCRNEGFSSIFLIQPPQLYNLRKNETLEYILHWKGFNNEETYFSSFINLGNQKEMIRLISSRKRRYLKKQLKKNQLKYDWNGSLDDFYPILCANKEKHGSKPTHSKEELKALIELMPDKFHLLMVYKDKIPIGGTFNFIANSQVAIIFYNMIDYMHEEYNSASLQILETMKWGKLHSLKFLDFGVSQRPKSESPLSPSPSLIQFKEQFSSSGMLRIAYSKKL